MAGRPIAYNQLHEGPLGYIPRNTGAPRPPLLSSCSCAYVRVTLPQGEAVAAKPTWAEDAAGPHGMHDLVCTHANASRSSILFVCVTSHALPQGEAGAKPTRAVVVNEVGPLDGPWTDEVVMEFLDAVRQESDDDRSR